MNIDKYIKNLHNSWKKLSKLPILSPIQINELNSNNALFCGCKLSDEIIKMYLYCFYNYPEFYTYDISKLNQPINEHNDNLYLIAAYKGHINIMEYLESKGFDINIKNNDGKNAYLMAASGGHINIMEYLESKGFDINIKNNDGENVYLIAAYKGHSEVMNYLESKGFDINIKNNNGDNAYLMAACGGHIDIMKYLESKGFDINIKNNNGKNAYLLAACGGYINIMEYLIISKYKIYKMIQPNEHCLICYINDNNTYIKCNYNHITHITCQVKSRKDYCLYCCI